MAVQVRFTSDAREAEQATLAYLHQDPVRHNVICTLLAANRRDRRPIRFWWAEHDGEVRGAVFQSPITFPAVVSILSDDVVEALAGALGDARPAVDGLNGFASDSSRLAGGLVTRTRRPGRPVEGQRVYEVRQVRRRPSGPGSRRTGRPDDVGLVTRWLAAFEAETGMPGSADASHHARAERFVASGNLHLWEVAGRAVASAVVAGPAAGVARVGFVFTPPELRGQGYASQLVASVSEAVLDRGQRCILYTQLENPTSNAIYQRLGYEPVGELVRYACS